MASARALALTNTDILYEIFEHLSLFPWPIKESIDMSTLTLLERDKRKLRALANAALTCRAFAEPASRALWAVLPDILPILSILFSLQKNVQDKIDIFTGTRYRETSYERVGDASVVDWKWARFANLASRVRCVVFGFYDIIIEPSILELIASRYTSRPGLVPLLPNLQVLAWVDSLGDSSRQKMLKALSLSPRLSCISIRNRFNSERFSAYAKGDIDIIATTSSARIYHFLASRPLNHDAVSLARMQSLRSVSLSYINASFFCALSSLPYLEELVCLVRGHEQSDDPEYTGLPAPYSGFPSLRSFRTARTTYNLLPATALSMIAPISSPYLTSLSFAISVGDVSDVTPCLEKISPFPAMRSLRKLDIRICHAMVSFGDGREPDRLVFQEIARPFQRLRSVEDFSIHVEHRILPLSDADMEQTLRWWPRIHRLSVSFDMHKDLHRKGISVERPSLYGLVMLAEKHRGLEHLDVEVVDVSEDDLARLEAHAASRVGTAGTSTSRLQSVTFARSSYRRRIRLSGIARLAEVLRALFPMLGGGLGEPIDWDASSDGDLPLYYGWPRGDMNTNVFQLLQKLEERKDC